MKKNLSLSIPQPCLEKWNNFTPAANGGFCSSCSKIVVDYTNMGDDELLEFLQKKSAHACGRFRPDQLRSYAVRTPLKVNPGFSLLKTGFISLLFLLISKQSFSQQLNTKSKTEVVQHPEYEVNSTVKKAGHVVTGVVKDEDKSPLPGVNVLLKGSTVGTVTDVDGRFEFPQKLNEGDMLVFSFIGFETQELVVQNNVGRTMEISLLMSCDVTIMGELAVDDVYESNPSALRKVWGRIKGLF